jgi:hypothetical protein
MTRWELFCLGWRCMVSAVLGAWPILAVLSGEARAHDWYPVECCGGRDCAAVTRVEVVAGAVFYAGKAVSPVPPSVMIVTTAQGTAIVPPNLPRLVSKDNRMHACLMNEWSSPEGMHKEVRCLFMPPTM